MKTRILIAIIMATITTFYACEKKETEPEIEGVAAKLQGKWMITGYTNDLGQEIYSSLPACEKDNIITYNNYTVSVDEGSLKCDAADPQSFSSTFALKGNGIDILTYVGNEGDDLDVMQIVFVDEATLKLKDATGNVGTITYTKIPQKVVYSQTSITGKWKLSGMVKNGVDVWALKIGTCAKGTDGSCTYSLDACVRDDTFTFTIDNKLISDEGINKCNSNGPQSITGSFTFNNAKNQITTTINGSTEINDIILLNTSTLIMRAVGDAKSDYAMYQRF